MVNIIIMIDDIKQV